MMYPQSDAILDKKTGETLVYSELLKGNREVMPSGYPMYPQSGLLRSKDGNDIDLVELLLNQSSGEGGGTSINDNNISKYTTYSSEKIENIKSEIENKIDKIIIGEGSGIAETDKVDYMGEQHKTLKETNDSNVEYLLRKVNTQKYEGSTITATNTYAKQVNNVILKGVTKYKDLDTGEFIDSYEEGRNLELVGGKTNEIHMRNENFISLNQGDIVIGGIGSNGVSNSKYKYGIMLREDLFIEAEPNKYCWIFITSSLGATAHVYTYDKDKNFIQKISQYKSIPENAKFIKFAYEAPYIVTDDMPIIADALNECKGIFVDSYIPNPTYDKIPNHQSSTVFILNNHPLYSIGTTYDYIDLETGIYVKNIDIREYQEGDESNGEVMTDMKNTIYKLDEPVISKIDLQGQKVYSYDGTTHYSCQSEVGYPSPILSLDVPTDLASLVSDQQVEIQLLNKENKELQSINQELKTTNDIQDELINTTMLATDEVFSLLEPLLVNAIDNLILDTNPLVNMYVAMVQRGLKKIEDIPKKYREQVITIINESKM